MHFFQNGSADFLCVNRMFEFVYVIVKLNGLNLECMTTANNHVIIRTVT